MGFPAECKIFPAEFVKNCIEEFTKKKGQPTTLVLNQEDCVDYMLTGFVPKSFMGLEVFMSDELPPGSLDIQIRGEKS